MINNDILFDKHVFIARQATSSYLFVF